MNYINVFGVVVVLLLLGRPCSCSIQRFRINPGFRGSQMNWVDNDGLILLSNSSNFAFGFVTVGPADAASFLLAVVHRLTSTLVWSANPASPVTHSDLFVFSPDGDAYLQYGNRVIWSTATTGATAMELLNSGNLVLLGTAGTKPLWQSFEHPTDTLLSGQSFTNGMSLLSKPNSRNLTFRLTVAAGDMTLYADFHPPQPYWSMQRDKRRIIDNQLGGGDSGVHSAILDPNSTNSWNFYDRNGSLLWQFIIADGGGDNTTLDDGHARPIWAAVLAEDGSISFRNIQNAGSTVSSSIKIPQDSCGTPQPCDPYYICYSSFSSTRCQCPAVLSSDSNCNPDIASPCGANYGSFELAKIDDGVGYFATGFVSPSMKSNATGCKDACMANCSCLALFFDGSAESCFLFNEIGSLQQLPGNSTSYVSYIKIFGDNASHGRDGSSGSGAGGKNPTVIVVISVATVVVIAALIYAACRIHKRKRLTESSQGSSEEDTFLENITGMPVRFTYRELLMATDNFSVKLGQGGFGSVYLGKLADGSRIAVKKLEGIGQGKKEFHAEVSIIGSIHHVHLVRLRGFCAEGSHRLLAYEYMANGSLDKWIFRSNRDDVLQLDWNRRFSIILGTAKGLAYLHEDCDAKIVHCDIKPENVLLDENYVAKVSDFGLAKLMSREQSHVFTTLRGTRGYLAPEWLTNYAISEKSDVYSFGMVLLEIIGGRKNFDPAETSEKAHFPSYAFKKMEEGRLKEVCDAKLGLDDKNISMEAAIKVALWCIQEDVSLRPSMMKVVQMLEGLTDVPQPPTSSQMGFRLYANVFKSTSEEGTSSGPSDCNSDAVISAVRLSGPR